QSQFADRRIEAAPPTYRVDRLEPTCRDQPGGWFRRNTVPRPLLDGGGEGIVHRVLREREVAQQTDERCEDPPRFSVVDLLDGCSSRLPPIVTPEIASHLPRSRLQLDRDTAPFPLVETDHGQDAARRMPGENGEPDMNRLQHG